MEKYCENSGLWFRSCGWARYKLKKMFLKNNQFYSSSGAIGLTFKDAKKRAKDVTYFKQNQQKYQMKMGSKNNKIACHHFRDRTMVF